MVLELGNGETLEEFWGALREKTSITLNIQLEIRMLNLCKGELKIKWGAW